MSKKSIIFIAIIISVFSGCFAYDEPIDPKYIYTEEDERRDIVSAHPELPEHIKSDILSGKMPINVVPLYVMHPEWDERTRQDISAGKVHIGMTKEQVIASWGSPYDINRTVGSWGVHEQWIYSSAYLYFEDGVLASFQD